MNQKIYNWIKSVKNRKCILNAEGQSFIEFILLLVVLTSLSFVMLKGFNQSIGDRWLSIVKVIAKPTPSTIELR